VFYVEGIIYFKRAIFSDLKLKIISTLSVRKFALHETHSANFLIERVPYGLYLNFGTLAGSYGQWRVEVHNFSTINLKFLIDLVYTIIFWNFRILAGTTAANDLESANKSLHCTLFNSDNRNSYFSWGGVWLRSKS
jgi:hypothetical protein